MVNASDPADAIYFERRAEQQLLMAVATDDPRACRCHYELASRYLDLIHPEHGPARKSFD